MVLYCPNFNESTAKMREENLNYYCFLQRKEAFLTGPITKVFPQFLKTELLKLALIVKATESTCQINYTNLVLKLEHAPESPANLVKTEICRPHPQICLFREPGCRENVENSCLYWSLGDADAADPRATFWDPLYLKHQCPVLAANPNQLLMQNWSEKCCSNDFRFSKRTFFFFKLSTPGPWIGSLAKNSLLTNCFSLWLFSESPKALWGCNYP